MTDRLDDRGEGAIKWHISKDGVVRRCHATKRPCDLQHYGTRDEAYAAIEMKNKGKAAHKSRKFRHRSGPHRLSYLERLKAKTESIGMAEVDDADFWGVDGF